MSNRTYPKALNDFFNDKETYEPLPDLDIDGHIAFECPKISDNMHIASHAPVSWSGKEIAEYVNFSNEREYEAFKTDFVPIIQEMCYDLFLYPVFVLGVFLNEEDQGLPVYYIGEATDGKPEKVTGSLDNFIRTYLKPGETVHPPQAPEQPTENLPEPYAGEELSATKEPIEASEEELQHYRNWWAGLELNWKKQFITKYTGAEDDPSDEELQHFMAKESVSVNRKYPVSSLRPLQQLSRLKELHFTDMEEDSGGDTIPYEIGALTQLSSVSLANNQWVLKNIDFLKPLTLLEALDLSGNIVYNIDALRGLKNLKALSLSADTFMIEKEFEADGIFEDLEPIGTLSQLEKLELIAIPADELSFLKNLENLKEFYLDESYVTELDDLAGCTQLEKLTLTSNPDLEHLDFLADLPNLEELHLSGNELIEDLDFLSALTTLERLYLEDQEVDDLSVLEALHQLRYLTLSELEIEDISPLIKLSALEHVSLLDIDGLTEQKTDQFKTARPEVKIKVY